MRNLSEEARVRGLEEAKTRAEDYRNLIGDPYTQVKAKDVVEDLEIIIRLLELGE